MRSGYPTAVFLILPEQFQIAEQSARDNKYMVQTSVDSALALQQSLNLAQQLRAHGQTVQLFVGDAATPDCVFPNNVFATSPGRVIIGNMRHEVRRQEARRLDIRHYFSHVLGRQVFDLTEQLPANEPAELTGCLVIDRARNIGFCGLTERCTRAGAVAMQAAFALEQMHVFELAAGEYHTNVVMSALAGRGLLICRDGFADPADADRIAALYAPDQVVWISREEKNNFAGNCIALYGDSAQLWMSARAANALSSANKLALERLGFSICSVDLSELEKAGGSLRCMIGEIY